MMRTQNGEFCTRSDTAGIDALYLPRACELNWVEARFAALRYFALDGTDRPARLTRR